jgi:lipooligosaccharide transport system permease protein
MSNFGVCQNYLNFKLVKVNNPMENILPDKARPVPSLARRLFAVWYRHYTVYNRDFFTNSFVTVIDPLLFFAAVGWGLASALGTMDGVSYLVYLVSSQTMMSVVFTSAFETSYGTYFRMAMDHNYDSMLVTPLGISDVFWGELLYVGTRAAFFSMVLLAIFAAFGWVPSLWAMAVPLVSFFTAISIGSLGYFANRLVKSLNHFNYFITGVISPLLLFSGTLFPIDRLPRTVGLVSAWLPLYPSVHLARMLTTGRFDENLWMSILYVVTAPWILGYFGVKCMRPKLIN